MTKLLFLDTETTGTLPDKNGIIQIAGIVEINETVKEEFNFKVKPFESQIIEDAALAVNGITREQIAEFPEPVEVYNKVLAIFDKYINRYNKQDKFDMVGHNVQFDYSFLNEWFLRNGNKYLYAYINYGRIDTVGLSAALRSTGLMKVENLKLASVAKHFSIELNAHDAMSDVRVCRDIYYRFTELLMKGNSVIQKIGITN
jgi:DNA polymerase-3 subunit epsilon